MITKAQIISLVEEKIIDTSIFLVDVQIQEDFSIFVFLDSEQEVSINDCIDISRHIDKQDFNLQVSSAGLDLPLKILKQYQKYIAWEIEIITVEGIKMKAILKEANENGIKITYQEKEKVENKKRKILITKELLLAFEEIKSTKIVPKF